MLLHPKYEVAMINDFLKNIAGGNEVRENLIGLTAELKKDKAGESHNVEMLSRLLCGDYAIFTELLKNDDAKIRKNSALILGEICAEEALPVIIETYVKEETLFNL